MEEINHLLKIADRLLAPEGCPWDRKQTFFTLQPYLLEEMHELMEAIDKEDGAMISEELGDVLYALIFVAKLAEQKKLFTFNDAVKEVCEKLIRRHPHVFGETKVHSTEEIVHNWEAIKKAEFKEKGRKTILDGIPPSLPILARARKVIQKLRHHKVELDLPPDDIGRRLWELIGEAESKGVDAESALRRHCQLIEEKFLAQANSSGQ